MHIVYKTTNLINNKIYIGVHNCSDENYLGSGLALKRAIKKYGKKNFCRETLKEFNSKNSAYKFEKQIVDQKFINRPDTYNMREGGRGGEYEISQESREKISKALTGIKRSVDTRNKISKAKLGLVGVLAPNYGKKHSSLTKKKMSQAHKGKKFSKESRLKMTKYKAENNNARKAKVTYLDKSTKIFDALCLITENLKIPPSTIRDIICKSSKDSKYYSPKFKVRIEKCHS